MTTSRAGWHQESAHAMGLLTPREDEVMRLVVQGWGYAHIAEELSLHSGRAVANYMNLIYHFLDLNLYPRIVRDHRASATYWYLAKNPHLLPTEEVYFEAWDGPIVGEHGGQWKPRGDRGPLIV